MGKDEDAALMLQLLLMLLLMEETPGKNDLKGKTAEIINLQNSCVPRVYQSILFKSPCQN